MFCVGKKFKTISEHKLDFTSDPEWLKHVVF